MGCQELRSCISFAKLRRCQKFRFLYDEKAKPGFFSILKMLEFFKEEEKVISLYAEAKKNYPLLAELMENKRPYLKDMLAEAKKLYEKNILGKTS